MGDDSGTGVCFTRDPNTGEKVHYGEFLPNAQGEDVVAGIRTPYPLEKMKDMLPSAYDELINIMDRLEAYFKDMQDIEFTVERGTLYILQTRNAKRTSQAAIRIAVDMVAEGLIDKKTAVLRVQPSDVERVLHPKFDDKERKNAKVIARGLPAAPGAATGRVYFEAHKAEKWLKQEKRFCLLDLKQVLKTLVV